MTFPRWISLTALGPRCTRCGLVWDRATVAALDVAADAPGGRSDAVLRGLLAFASAHLICGGVVVERVVLDVPRRAEDEAPRPCCPTCGKEFKHLHYRRCQACNPCFTGGAFGGLGNCPKCGKEYQQRRRCNRCRPLLVKYPVRAKA